MFAYCNNNPIVFIDPLGTYSMANIVSAIQSIASFVNKVALLTKDNNKSDYLIGFGVVVDIGQGWRARIDRGQNDITGKETHVHVWKDGDSFSQNNDGTPHHGSNGNPPKKVRDRLKEKTGWEWKIIGTVPEIPVEYNNQYAAEFDINYIFALGLIAGILVFVTTGNPVGLQGAFVY